MISNCCGASVIQNTDLCSDCKEHCTPINELAWLNDEWSPLRVTYYTNKDEK